MSPRATTFLGTVQDVQGSTLRVDLAQLTATGLKFVDGRGYRVGQIGSFVRVSVGFSNLFGIVSQVGAGPESDELTQSHGHRWISVELVGEGSANAPFRRGVSMYPTIGDEVHLVTDSDLRVVYGTGGEGRFVRIGALASSDSIDASVDIDRLVSRHSAVVGSTGSGKSTTVAGILASITDPTRFPSARVVVIDTHGEYHRALGDRATVFRTSPDLARGEKSLHVPYWAMNADELLAATPLGASGETERAAILDKIRELKRASLVHTPRAGTTHDDVTVDTPTPFSIHRLWYELHREVLSTHSAQQSAQSSATEAIELDGAGAPRLGSIMQVIPPSYRPTTQGGPNRIYYSGSTLNLRRQIFGLQSLLRDGRFDFLFRPGPWCPEASTVDPDAQPVKDLDELMSAWLDGKQPISILDLSGVPTSVLIPLVGVVLRLLMDAMFWGRNVTGGGRQRPVLVVMEEAHAYLAPGRSDAAANAAKRIVKEGRKYGVGAMVVSQRPSEIDSTILSQCGTMIALRLTNHSDRAQVSATVSENLEGLFAMLPTLRTGEAVVVGEAVQLPLRAVMDPPAPNRRPDSEDPLVFDSTGEAGWNCARQATDFSTALEKWREERA